MRYGLIGRMPISSTLAVLLVLTTAPPAAIAADDVPESEAIPQFAPAPEARQVRGVAPAYDGTRAVFASTDIPLGLADNGPGEVTSIMAVDSQGAIEDLDVHLAITHTWVGDLEVVLTHVDTGTSVSILDRPGVPTQGQYGCLGDGIDATLDDEAGDPVEDTCFAGDPPPLAIEGRFSPNNPLSGFDGESIGGRWQLKVIDHATGDTGSLDSWSLSVEQPATGHRAGLYAAEVDSAWTGDVASKIHATSKVAWVDVYDVRFATPSLADLQRYDSVMVWSNYRFGDPVAMGDVLADYVDAGGGVAVNSVWSSGFGIEGRIVTDEYLPLTTGATMRSGDGPYVLVPKKATHSLLSDVATFDGGPGSWRTDTTLTDGSLLVATWSSPGREPLVATKSQPSGRVVGLNFAPMSDDVFDASWDAATDGGELAANALLFAATPPEFCQGRVATLDGTAGDDILNGTAGDDVIAAGPGDDLINGGGGNDLICGADGDDTMLGGPGDDTLLGGSGGDTVSFGGATGGVVVDLAAGQSSGQGTDALVSIEHVIGSRFGDKILGNSGGNSLKGFRGDDTIEGRGGDDLVSGGAGADALFGGPGDDRVDGYSGSDEIRGGAGSDLLRGWSGDDIIYPAAGDDTVKGGSGFDMVNYSGSPGPITADLKAGTVVGNGYDTLTGIFDVVGTAYSDEISGDGNPNYLNGSGGDDAINGRSGDDTIDGWFGADAIRGGPGNDELSGYDGADTIRGGTGDDIVFGESGSDVVYGDRGADYLDGGPGVNDLYGGPGQDECTNGRHFVSCEVITALVNLVTAAQRFARLGPWAAMVERDVSDL
jgi:Ca2+-binding RTX toxin-like protein/subtilisin-like proprotein convertase family protein